METARAATSRWLLCVAAVAMVLLGFAAAQPKPFRPTLISFSPTQGAAGSTVTITFTGMNFVPRSSMLGSLPALG